MTDVNEGRWSFVDDFDDECWDMVQPADAAHSHHSAERNGMITPPLADYDEDDEEAVEMACDEVVDLYREVTSQLTATLPTAEETPLHEENEEESEDSSAPEILILAESDFFVAVAEVAKKVGFFQLPGIRLQIVAIMLCCICWPIVHFYMPRSTPNAGPITTADIATLRNQIKSEMRHEMTNELQWMERKLNDGIRNGTLLEMSLMENKVKSKIKTELGRLNIRKQIKKAKDEIKDTKALINSIRNIDAQVTKEMKPVMSEIETEIETQTRSTKDELKAFMQTEIAGLRIPQQIRMAKKRNQIGAQE